MSKDQSFVMVSAEWAIRAAKKIKCRIYKTRMECLKKQAEKNLSTPLFIFFGKKRTFTKKELNKEMYRLWHSDDLVYSTADFHWRANILLETVNNIIKAASVAENGILFLSVEDASDLNRYDDVK